MPWGTWARAMACGQGWSQLETGEELWGIPALEQGVAMGEGTPGLARGHSGTHGANVLCILRPGPMCSTWCWGQPGGSSRSGAAPLEGDKMGTPVPAAPQSQVGSIPWWGAPRPGGGDTGITWCSIPRDSSTSQALFSLRRSAVTFGCSSTHRGKQPGKATPGDTLCSHQREGPASVGCACGVHRPQSPQFTPAQRKVVPMGGVWGCSLLLPHLCPPNQLQHFHSPHRRGGTSRVHPHRLHWWGSGYLGPPCK